MYGAIEGPENEIAARAAGLGFEWIDVRPFAFSSRGARRKIREHGLSVSCIAASFGMPDGARLSSPDRDSRSAAASHLDRTLDFGASLGASAAYVVPDEDPSSLDRYASALKRLAERGDGLGVRVCVEHFPGTDSAAYGLRDDRVPEGNRASQPVSASGYRPRADVRRRPRRGNFGRGPAAGIRASGTTTTVRATCILA